MSRVVKPAWLSAQDFRPYVFVRPENRAAAPGKRHTFDWFRQEPIVMEPLLTENVTFGEQIMKLDSKAFGSNGLVTPRWVFYDCGVMPGLVVGFAGRRQALPKKVLEALEPPEGLEWVPLSLFMAVPTAASGHWMAHNLCSVNSLLSEKDRFHKMGFLSKAFGLWYFNVSNLYGVAQWNSPSLRLHASFGPIRLETAYTPLHDYPESVTYNLVVNATQWKWWFDKRSRKSVFLERYEDSGYRCHPSDPENLQSVQRMIEEGKRFYLFAEELEVNNWDQELTLYRPR